MDLLIGRYVHHTPHQGTCNCHKQEEWNKIYLTDVNYTNSKTYTKSNLYQPRIKHKKPIWKDSKQVKII